MRGSTGLAHARGAAKIRPWGNTGCERRSAIGRARPAWGWSTAAGPSPTWQDWGGVACACGLRVSGSQSPHSLTDFCRHTGVGNRWMGFSLLPALSSGTSGRRGGFGGQLGFSASPPWLPGRSGRCATPSCGWGGVLIIAPGASPTCVTHNILDRASPWSRKLFRRAVGTDDGCLPNLCRAFPRVVGWRAFLNHPFVLCAGMPPA